MNQATHQQQIAPGVGGGGPDGGEGRGILGTSNFSPHKNPFTLNTRHTVDISLESELPESSTPVFTQKDYLPQVALPKSPLPPLQKSLNSSLDYTSDIGEKMLEFFCGAEPTRIVVDVMTWKNGEIREVEREVPNPPPSFSKFARSIGTTTYRLNLWKKNHPEFKEYYDECNQVIKEFIIENGLSGKYASAFAIFAAKNLTNMKDKTITENRNINMNKFLDQLEKGEIIEGELAESY